MASAEVLGIPGLPGGAFNTYNDSSFSPSQESMTRSYATFVGMDSSIDELPTRASHFDANKHLVYEGPTKVHTMEDIGLQASNGVSPIAVSEPFRLFSKEAIMEMRKEIFAENVLNKYCYQSDIAPMQLRGYAPKEAKFIYDAWKSPKTLAILSEIAGVDLVPVIDYEIGHINISKPGNRQDANEAALDVDDDDKAVVDWHRDSYPFVCVLMMSDTTNMVGGETALKAGNGEIRKVRGPEIGCAVVLQGRYIDHQALRAFGGQERITMVTSLRPKSPFVRDDTVLNTVRPISNLPDLYGQTIEYSLENMEARLRRMLKKVRLDMKAGVTDVTAYKKHFDFEIQTLQRLNHEIVEEHKVTKGRVADEIEAERKAREI
ncbi:MAG: hypothetical protein M1818_001730 [Claussenomyces sp. TS43310]|nr:MAG: hypothetical protein M1818_001730 [Claussenomyces sp. TS43310]